MRSRLLVVVAFLAMAAVPAYLAWSTGLLPGPQQASAESTSPATTSSAAVASLAWPEEPLGLAAGEARIYWEQRDRSAAVAGLWYHDVPSGDTERLLGRDAAGKSGGFPAAAGHLIAWEYWAGKRGEGPAAIQAFNLEIAHRWRLTDGRPRPERSGRHRVLGRAGRRRPGQGRHPRRERAHRCGVRARDRRPREELRRLGPLGGLDLGDGLHRRGLGRLLPQRDPLPAGRQGHGRGDRTATASCGPPQRAGTPPRSSRGTAGPAAPGCSAVCGARRRPSR